MGTSMRDASARWLPPLLWMAAIFIVSDQPSLPQAPDAFIDMLIKKTLHAAAYAILAWLWWRALDGRGETSDHRAIDLRRALTALAITGIYAISDEWHQTFVPGRMGKVTDVMIDVAGAIVAIATLAAGPAVAARGRRAGLRDSQ